MRAERLVVRDRAGCLWLMGLAFAAGGVTVLALLFGARSGARPAGWGSILVALIGCAHIAAGTWLMVSTPNTTVRLRHDRPILQISKRWLLHYRTREIHLDQIAHFHIRKSEDSEGDPVYRLWLYLRTGEELPLHSVALHAREELDAVTDRLRSWSGGRLAARVGRPGDLTD
jgi:hypothetical protein